MNASRRIAGEWTGTPTFDSIDPATGEAIGEFADGGADEADAAIAAARHVFDRTTWAQDARLR
ncbi:aldehyde dehydrogenase family protein [Paraburkholderia sp. MM5482-R1]|uniref:aldehyde dehydrogenase family protein n=1 Tax=unclassified Paraburkholderia TaxID=2615204 RepID=UPI003D1FB92A